MVILTVQVAVVPIETFDNNQCGDTLKTDGLVFLDITLNDVLCQDSDNNREVDIAFVLTWQQQTGSCNDPFEPSNFYPPSSSKCIAGVVNIAEIDPLPPELLPSIIVHKSVSPTVLQEPGGDVLYSLIIENNGPISIHKTADRNIILSGADVAFTITVTNTSYVPLTNIRLSDSQFGDLTTKGCILPPPLAGGDHFTCTFTETIIGNAGDLHTNVATVTADESQMLRP